MNYLRTKALQPPLNTWKINVDCYKSSGKCRKNYRTSRFELLEYLSFGEYKSVKEAAGSMSFTFTNSQTHEIDYCHSFVSQEK